MESRRRDPWGFSFSGHCVTGKKRPLSGWCGWMGWEGKGGFYCSCARETSAEKVCCKRVRPHSTQFRGRAAAWVLLRDSVPTQLQRRPVRRNLARVGGYAGCRDGQAFTAGTAATVAVGGGTAFQEQLIPLPPALRLGEAAGLARRGGRARGVQGGAQGEHAGGEDHSRRLRCASGSCVGSRG